MARGQRKSFERLPRLEFVTSIATFAFAGHRAKRPLTNKVPQDATIMATCIVSGLKRTLLYVTVVYEQPQDTDWKVHVLLATPKHLNLV